MKKDITTALDRFTARNAGKVFMPIPFFLGLAAAVVLPKAYDHFTAPAAMEAVVAKSSGGEMDILALEAAIGSKKAILDELEKNEGRRESLIAASEALQKMINARNPAYSAYGEGPDAEERRKKDIEAAGFEYESAISAAGLGAGAAAGSPHSGGPDTSFKIDETEFTLDAIEALGGDVETARRTMGMTP